MNEPMLEHVRPAPSPAPPRKIEGRDKTIVRLSDELTRLHEENNRNKQALKEVALILFCHGGPLHSNIDQYTKSQLHNFFKIKQVIDI